MVRALEEVPLLGALAEHPQKGWQALHVATMTILSHETEPLLLGPTMTMLSHQTELWLLRATMTILSHHTEIWLFVAPMTILLRQQVNTFFGWSKNTKTNSFILWELPHSRSTYRAIQSNCALGVCVHLAKIHFLVWCCHDGNLTLSWLAQLISFGLEYR